MGDVAKRGDDRSRGWFSKSGHTSHARDDAPPPVVPAAPPPPPRRDDFGSPTYHQTRPVQSPPPRPDPREDDRYYRDERGYRDRRYPDDDRGYRDERAYGREPRDPRERRYPDDERYYRERDYDRDPRDRDPRDRDPRDRDPRDRDPRDRDPRDRDYDRRYPDPRDDPYDPRYDPRPEPPRDYYRDPRDDRDYYRDPRDDRDLPPRRDDRVNLGKVPGAPQDPKTAQRPAVALARGAVSGTQKVARNVTRKVIRASKSDGAEESGLTPLIWNQVLSYGTDAMITVALAGTVFFGAAADAKRGNVLLYLLITMAPFAVVAPVIGPLLDRFQHGRRWVMAATGFGRAALALVMAAHSTELLVLYPCALGSLVLSKAYSVLRASAAPRLVPPGLTLGQANAKLTIFGLGSTLIFGGVVGIVIKLSGSYSFGLVLTAIAFAACGWFAIKLPKQIDSAVRAPRHPDEPRRPAKQDKVPALRRLRLWARRGFDEHLVIALQGESALRFLSGLLTIFLAFYIEGAAHGFEAAWKLGGVVAAAGGGNFVGTALGTRIKTAHPTRVIVLSVAAAAAACVIGAIMFDLFLVVILAMFVGAVTNAVSKISLDSLIQHSVVETLRSSAFARSETFLQLAWVLGAAFGVGLSMFEATSESAGFWFTALVLGAVAVLTALRSRAVARAESDTRHYQAPGPWDGGGSVTQRSHDH
jgi:MFS family permease